MVKLLIDEDLSPTVGAALRREGVDAVHVRDRGLLGAVDSVVLEAAYAEDRVLVTANVGDFRALAAARDVHCGIVLIEHGQMLRVEQVEIIRRVVAWLADHGDLMNEALTVTIAGDLTVERLPP